MDKITLHGSNASDMAEQWITALTNRLADTPSNKAIIGSLIVLLDGMNWRGSARQIAEALPYDCAEIGQADFLDILARLGFKPRPVKESIGKISERLCPYLLLDANNNPHVVLEKTNKGLHVFSGAKEEREWIKPNKLKGKAFSITPLDLSEKPPVHEMGGWLRSMAGHFKNHLSLAVFTTFFINLLALSVPLTVMAIYDQVISKEQPEIMPMIIAGMAIAFLFEMGMRLIRAKIQSHLGGRMDYLVGTKVFEQILHLPPLFTERAPVGGQVTRLREFEQLREFFTGPMSVAVMDLPFVFIFIVVIALLAPPVALVPAILLIAFIILAIITVPLVRDRSLQSAEGRSKRYTFLVEFIWWLRSIKQMGAEKIWKERYKSLSADACFSNFNLSSIQGVTQEISQTLMNAAGIATLMVGVFQTMEGNMTQGALIATMMLVWRILTPLHTLFGLFSRGEQIRQSLERLVQLLNYNREQEPGDTPSAMINFSGRLSFNRVSMRYSQNSNPALLSVDFTAEPGEFIGITGSSGSGKSTLAKVALGIYQPQAGTVTLNEIDIRQLRPITLRQSMSYVPQRNHAFPGTLFHNLITSHPSASREEVINACKLVGLHDAIESLPNGYETKFRDGLLAHVPQGFLRKLGLARAVLRPSTVLILDEPAGSMDDEDEKDFIKMLQTLHGTRTILMISHRPSHMRLCDRLIVMDQGQVAMSGKPDEILNRIIEQNINLTPPPEQDRQERA